MYEERKNDNTGIDLVTYVSMPMSVSGGGL